MEAIESFNKEMVNLNFNQRTLKLPKQESNLKKMKRINIYYILYKICIKYVTVFVS